MYDSLLSKETVEGRNIRSLVKSKTCLGFFMKTPFNLAVNVSILTRVHRVLKWGVVSETLLQILCNLQLTCAFYEDQSASKIKNVCHSVRNENGKASKIFTKLIFVSKLNDKNKNKNVLRQCYLYVNYGEFCMSILFLFFFSWHGVSLFRIWHKEM